MSAAPITRADLNRLLETITYAARKTLDEAVEHDPDGVCVERAWRAILIFERDIECLRQVAATVDGAANMRLPERPSDIWGVK